MRIFVLLMLLTACASQEKPPVMVPMIIKVPEAAPPKPENRPKPRASSIVAAPDPPAALPPAQNPCANLNTGDLTESVRLKLDCMERNRALLPVLPPINP